MITAVDTSVLFDVFLDDPKFCKGSAAALVQVAGEGIMVACEVVWAEASAAFMKPEMLIDMFNRLEIGFDPMKKEAAIQAGRAWKIYREDGGPRERVVADFLIGAHALSQCDRLLTRDRGFYCLQLGGLKPPPLGGSFSRFFVSLEA